ncbi:5-(carboxyamino)imidazole ribonucleotide synthase [Acidipropionibacterium jensenii]|uniref:5-(carboxyamino)imidazole ribonucleotide synthase n=1 Tax=Acidipropionibacterium jensenii TaxID=1749 RepID=UPI00214BDA96|nr:5-(carboxyamino)imidazole ribonucleotide synthase [Acidipropionibacterium jensenii]
MAPTSPERPRSADPRGQYRVGIIGGGQLARMMHQAAISLGVDVRLLADAPDESAAQVMGDVQIGSHLDHDAVLAFGRDCDVVTFDHEHVPTDFLREMEAEGIAVRPGAEALVHAQDKAVMRARAAADGQPCPDWEICGGPEKLVAFGNKHGWPVIAKTSRGGYDGKGVWKVNGPDEVAEPFDATGGLADGDQPIQILAEEFVDFTRELSAIVVRSPSGQAVAYPVSETIQRDGICVETTTPAPGMSDERQCEIQQMALDIAGRLGVVGVMAVELMERADGSVVINELAMRPHNTGHWTIHGSRTSQFANHIRAVLDLPLGDPSLTAPVVVMDNVLGGSVQDLTGALQHCFARDRSLHVELYGKQVRPGRKVGHVTCLGSDVADVQRRARDAAGYLMGRDNA